MKQFTAFVRGGGMGVPPRVERFKLVDILEVRNYCIDIRGRKTLNRIYGRDPLRVARF